MTQSKKAVEQIAELNSLFLTLNDKGQDATLTILKSLSFAQSVMCLSNNNQQREPPENKPA